MSLIINTSQCKIPNFDPFDQDVLPFIKIQNEPQQTQHNWSFIRDNVRTVNNKTK
jgi:hypothetical protein